MRFGNVPSPELINLHRLAEKNPLQLMDALGEGLLYDEEWGISIEIDDWIVPGD